MNCFVFTFVLIFNTVALSALNTGCHVLQTFNCFFFVAGVTPVEYIVSPPSSATPKSFVDRQCAAVKYVLLMNYTSVDYIVWKAPVLVDIF